MTFRNTTRSWGTLSKALHWIIVLLIISQWFIAHARGRPAQRTRETPGARLAQVVRHDHPHAGDHPVSVALDESGSRPHGRDETLGARAREDSHVLLYALIFAMPLTGWLMSSARKFPGELVQSVPVPRSRRARPKRCFDQHERPASPAVQRRSWSSRCCTSPARSNIISSTRTTC